MFATNELQMVDNLNDDSLITNISSGWLAERAEPRRFWKLGVRFYQRGQKK